MTVLFSSWPGFSEPRNIWVKKIKKIPRGIGNKSKTRENAPPNGNIWYLQDKITQYRTVFKNRLKTKTMDSGLAWKKGLGNYILPPREQGKETPGKIPSNQRSSA